MTDESQTAECLLTSTVGTTRWLTMNRPNNGNSFTQEMLRRLRAALEDARAAREVRVVVITGAGDRFFCIGGEHSDQGENLDYATVMAVVDLYQFIDQMPKPVIAAVNGYAVGGV